MIDQVKQHLEAVAAFDSSDPKEIEAFRIQYAGKKGVLNALFAAFRDIAPQDKKEFGQVLNQLKTAVSEKVKELTADQGATSDQKIIQDPFRSSYPISSGARHPLETVKK